MNSQAGVRAVVLGGSIAGTLAARVLAESYQDVVVVDRDKLLGVRVARKGAPHAHHAHGLHARGHLILEDLFPGLTDEVVAAGAFTTDLGRIRWIFNGRRVKPADTGLVTVAPSRPVLENHVRTRVAALPNVTYLEEHDILRLVTTGDHRRVTGVVVRRQADDTEVVLDADVVVDTTGRGSRTPAWLDELGYERPEEERVKVGLAYTTRHYRVGPEPFDGAQSIVPVASPAHPRGAFFGQLGGGVCVLSLTGILGDHPPTDPEGFLEFARTLPVPDVYDAVRDAPALEDPVSFRFPASVRRRYERLTRFPAGLLVLGDAFCSFNPVYGQGMTVAALEVLALRELLRSGDVAPLPFFAAISKVIDAPWDISVGGDLSYPGVEGPRPAKVKIANAYMARLQYAATKDPKVTEAFMRVAGLIDPPEALFKPGTVRRVLRHAFRTPAPGPSWLDTAPPTGARPRDLPEAA
ncbi:FAD-dependent oxidoreductase [Amycolatopsis sp. NPDC051102]|uniref:FAD-dependent oxidoreductase n=1 Tax=Amycolatopsis sp. NPDC051102 TaxID=3155163 RepID=UPI00341C9127